MKNFQIPGFYRSPIISRIKQFRKVQDPRKKDLTPIFLDFGPVGFYIARHFGFCYGVENAIEIASSEIYDIEKIMFTQSWISHKLPGQIHKDHSHSNSIISGVYYFDNNSTTEPITFYRSTGVNGINSLQVAVNESIARPMFECEIQPQFGDIILFPSYLFHSVKINTSGKVRKSLAFNCVPPIFGKKEDLTELIIT